MADNHYSGTPLWKKLGMHSGSRVLLIDAPAHFRSLIEPLPESVRVTSRPARGQDVIVMFESRAAGFGKRLAALAKALNPAGGLWVAYPKKTSKLPTDLTFEKVQAAGLKAGLVDNKSCAIDADWSAVRFVYRLKDRPTRA